MPALFISLICLRWGLLVYPRVTWKLPRSLGCAQTCNRLFAFATRSLGGQVFTPPPHLTPFLFVWFGFETGSCYVTLTGFKVMVILLPPPPWGWHDRLLPHRQVYAVAGAEPRLCPYRASTFPPGPGHGLRVWQVFPHLILICMSFK